ncbi:MAG TPA: hypothetical protein GX711_10555 [Clostridia bacterium]|nr:hypothetical protein [Clostridia bacterium]
MGIGLHTALGGINQVIDPTYPKMISLEKEKEVSMPSVRPPPSASPSPFAAREKNARHRTASRGTTRWPNSCDFLGKITGRKNRPVADHF